jgi:NitT/TauT family transport system ATP-binding protein
MERIHELRGTSILFITHAVEEADSIVLLSARPGRVREKIDVPLPRPRIGTAEAVDLIPHLRALLEESSEGIVR